MKKSNWYLAGEWIGVVIAFIACGIPLWYIYKVTVGIYHLLDKLIDKI